jgi:hypothetical protein
MPTTTDLNNVRVNLERRSVIVVVVVVVVVVLDGR